MLPPAEISSVDLWLQITAMPRPSRVVEFPRKKPDGTPVGELRLVILSQEEQMLCAAEAERYTKKAIKDLPKADEAQLGYANVYNNAAAVEVLFNACKQKDDIEKSFFPSREALRRFLTPDEVGVLMVHYYTAQAELGPIVATMSEPELDAWIARLGEGGTRFPLDLLSWDAVKDLAYFLALRIHASRTATTSPGSLPGNEPESPITDPDPPT